MSSSKRKNTRGISQFTTKKSKHRSTLLDTVKIGNLLGKGCYGTVFLATDKDNNKYACKIEKLLKEDVKKSLKSPHWRELYFISHLASKHPTQFLQLHDSRIMDECKFRQYYPENYSSLTLLRQDSPASKMDLSPYCSLKLWSLIDGNLQELLYPETKLSNAEFPNILIQIVNIIDIMQSAGFLHNDFHWGNIAFTRVAPSTTIEVCGRQIPTHGYIMKAIDYGKVLHKNFKLSASEKLQLNKSSDLFKIVEYFSIKKTSITLDGTKWHWFKEWHAKFSVPASDKKELEVYLPTDKRLDSTARSFLIKKLFKLLRYEKWQRSVLNKPDLVGIPPDHPIPLPTILFIIKNIYNASIVLEMLLAVA
jgi:serine/threonine protein kinase